jgi:hypothetical protein
MNRLMEKFLLFIALHPPYEEEAASPSLAATRVRVIHRYPGVILAVVGKSQHGQKKNGRKTL